ncbi:hypothetical protein EVAR_23693_1 [Eumeta japonica]|uniref:Uncharacterized protein n=1 Tax=Eumeta variegata TaxID=151549 RepID=A0A4C1VHR9_EUMVA|nr:hypothetical protein EVAR_23693_1 [Eumeta japonica]
MEYLIRLPTVEDWQQWHPFNKIIINTGANGRRRGGGGGRGPGGQRGSGSSLIDSRPRDTLYLSSHRCPLAGRTKKEIGFADFDPFVFGQRPAGGRGLKKARGADWPSGPRPRHPRPAPLRPANAAQPSQPGRPSSKQSVFIS